MICNRFAYTVDADGWVRQFEGITKSNWKVRFTYPLKRTIQRKDYVCHHQDFRHTERKGTKCEARVKFTGCKAKMIIKVGNFVRKLHMKIKLIMQLICA